MQNKSWRVGPEYWVSPRFSQQESNLSWGKFREKPPPPKKTTSKNQRCAISKMSSFIFHCINDQKVAAQRTSTTSALRIKPFKASTNPQNPLSQNIPSEWPSLHGHRTRRDVVASSHNPKDPKPAMTHRWEGQGPPRYTKASRESNGTGC